MACKRSEFVREALEMARQLAILADTGEVDVEDDGCAVLSCVIRDCAYVIRRRAEQERDSHRERDSWGSAGASSVKQAGAV